ncbi:PD-(D/E)XK motif protein [Arthrobacter sp. TMP15]|uniref:PD-(D/E)XK motif protein n=1 Tax=Arthrobacter sp. TMP15 TaxID=3140789 RepID=UPI0031BB612F
MSTIQPPKRSISLAIDVREGHRSDGLWTQTFILRDKSLSEPFQLFCSLMHREVSATATEPAGLQAVEDSIEHWTRLLRRGWGQQLSRNEMRGLFGELHFGFEVLAPHIPADTAVLAWTGPFEADQDYNFQTAAFEVKSRTAGFQSIRISSEDQLGAANLTLAVVVVSEAAGADHGYRTLPDLVAETRTKLSAVGNDALDLAFGELGFDPSDPAYDSYWFLAGEAVFYSITDGFPRIVSEQLPEAISRVTYALDLQKLDEFRCDLPQLQPVGELA